MNIWVVESSCFALSFFDINIYLNKYDAYYNACYEAHLKMKNAGCNYKNSPYNSYYNKFVDFVSENTEKSFEQAISVYISYNSLLKDIDMFNIHVYSRSVLDIERNVINKDNILPQRKEAPCCVCGRNNDIGVKICWCCGSKI